MIEIGENYSMRLGEKIRAVAVKHDSGFAGLYDPMHAFMFTPTNTEEHQISREDVCNRAIQKIKELVGFGLSRDKEFLFNACENPTTFIAQTIGGTTVLYVDELFLRGVPRQIAMQSYRFGGGCLAIEPPIEDVDEVICEEILDTIDTREPRSS